MGIETGAIGLKQGWGQVAKIGNRVREKAGT